MYTRQGGHQDVWTGVENLAHSGIRSPDRPARSESLYRLRYPGPLKSTAAKSAAVANVSSRYIVQFRHVKNLISIQLITALSMLIYSLWNITKVPFLILCSSTFTASVFRLKYINLSASPTSTYKITQSFCKTLSEFFFFNLTLYRFLNMTRTRDG